jgi:hypothetical protein
MAADIDPARLPPAVQKEVRFRDDIYPLLAQRCFRCHRGSDPKSGYRLDVRADILGESDGRPLAVKGKSAQSRLIHLVSGVLEEAVMPPSGERLSPEEVGLLRAWIDQGLSWDDNLLPPPAVASKHWAFQPVRRPEAPPVRHPDWVRTPVDAFIAAAQDARGLVPAPEASRRVLLRRLTFDLTGLPPTPQALDDFLADRSPDAYERVVERLLASPHYGERWGRHWLDVARYADSEGYEIDAPRPFAWRYRDYVVRSFNDDKPYDQFLRQQVAGDELVPYSDENLIATGFLASARDSSNQEDKVMRRNDALVDITNATASAVLGLTLGCAQCHNHKFDPVTQRDYYRFQGFFVQGQINHLVLKGPALWKNYEAAYAAAKPAAYDPANELRRALYDEAQSRLVAEARKKLAPEVVAALDRPDAQRTPEQRELARKAEPGLQFKPEEVEKAITGEDKQLYDALKKKLAALEKLLPAKPQTTGFYSPATSPTPVEVLRMTTNPMAMFLPYEPEELKKTRPYLLVRGDVHQRGPEVDIGWPALLGPAPGEKIAAAPRTALAEWMAAPSNPLTARVWANRVWHYHFGRGLVATPGDFGVKGAPPTHPELLDYLASELMHQGWSTKHLHRLIVRSATYRQAARVDAECAKRDPENNYLWRWSPRRLETEAVRDALVAVSGELNPALGGPGVPVAKKAHYDSNEAPEETETVLRRSLYLEHRRNALPPMYSLLDGPAAIESCGRRHVSTVPLQPLFLLNSAFALNRAKAFAARVSAQAGRDPDHQIDVAFHLALARLPDEAERRVARTLWEPPSASGGEEGKPQAKPPAEGRSGPSPELIALCQLLFNLNEFVYLE